MPPGTPLSQYLRARRALAGPEDVGRSSGGLRRCRDCVLRGWRCLPESVRTTTCGLSRVAIGIRRRKCSRDDELGEVLVADDPSELLLGDEHAGGGPALAPVAVLSALDVALCVADDLDDRLAGVRRAQRLGQVPVDPRRIIVTVSGMPSRSEPAASGHVRSSSPASSGRRCSASCASVSDHAARIRERTWSRSRSGSRSVTSSTRTARRPRRRDRRPQQTGGSTRRRASGPSPPW